MDLKEYRASGTYRVPLDPLDRKIAAVLLHFQGPFEDWVLEIENLGPWEFSDLPLRLDLERENWSRAHLWG